MSRACPNGHPIDPETASRFCPTCSALLVPAESAAAHVARASEKVPPRDAGRISPRAMGIGLALLAVGIGILAALIALNAPPPSDSQGTSVVPVVRIA